MRWFAAFMRMAWRHIRTNAVARYWEKTVKILAKLLNYFRWQIGGTIRRAIVLS
jgi:hypothetical protein